MAKPDSQLKRFWAWMPAALMGVGAVFTVGLDTQRSMSLEFPLDSIVPVEIAGYVGSDIEISDAEVAVAAPTAYLMRSYVGDSVPNEAPEWFSLYIGYYERQLRGVTIHSPKNCLPGAGWEALASEEVVIDTEIGGVSANRYMLQREDERALVLYWYQGRGRVESNEYLVKLDLLRDAATRRRSEEALVRIVVPVVGSEGEAFDLATTAAGTLVPALNQALPAW